MPLDLDRWKLSEQRQRELIEFVRALPADAQRTRPNSRDFAPSEVIEHMALTDKFYAEMLAKPVPDRAPNPNFLYRMVVRRMNSAARTPTFKMLEPPSPPLTEKAAAHWEDVRAKIRALAETRADAPSLFKHPLFGRLGQHDLLDLLDAHVRYHVVRLSSAEMQTR